MATRKIDLNKFEMVNTEADLDGYTGVILVPKKLDSGVQLPPLYFRTGKQKPPTIEDVSNSIWYRDCHIGNDGSLEEYSTRVDWWYEQALKDNSYRQMLNTTFNNNGFDVKMSWEKSKVWLKTCLPSERKTYIHKFVWDWLRKGLRWQMNRIEKERKSK